MAVHIGKCPVAPQLRRHGVASDATEHRGVGDAVAAEAVGAVHATGVLAGRVEARHRRGAVRREHHAAHHVMGGRDHLDAPGREIEAAVGATLDHALEFTAHAVGTEMAHLDPYAAIRAGVAAPDAIHDGAADAVAGGALAPRVVGQHEEPAR